MSTSNEHSAWVCAVSWVAALLATGCFDVERVDVRVSGSQIIRIDDFEDGDTLPSDRRFGPWQCFPFSSVQSPPTCRISAGYAGGHGLSMEFELGGDATGVAYGTAMIPSAKGGRETLDVTSFSRIDFDMKWDIDSPELNSGNVVAVHLPCISLKYTEGASPSGYAVSLNSADLNVVLSDGFSMAQGDKFTIIDNKSSRPVYSTFKNLAEGTVFSVADGTFSISYVGGDGNDVVLTVVSAPSKPAKAPNTGFKVLSSNPLLILGLGIITAGFFLALSSRRLSVNR